MQSSKKTTTLCKARNPLLVPCVDYQRSDEYMKNCIPNTNTNTVFCIRIRIWNTGIRVFVRSLLITHVYRICATGYIRVPKIPEEFKQFQGPILHTALWDESVHLRNKRVAVVGKEGLTMGSKCTPPIYNLTRCWSQWGPIDTPSR